MARMIVIHPVEDFGKWKSVFDSLETVHKNAGATALSVYQGFGAPNNVVVVTDWGTHEQAKAWGESPELQTAMKEAGVAGPPGIYFVD